MHGERSPEVAHPRRNRAPLKKLADEFQLPYSRLHHWTKHPCPLLGRKIKTWRTGEPRNQLLGSRADVQKIADAISLKDGRFSDESGDWGSRRVVAAILGVSTWGLQKVVGRAPAILGRPIREKEVGAKREAGVTRVGPITVLHLQDVVDFYGAWNSVPAESLDSDWLTSEEGTKLFSLTQREITNAAAHGHAALDGKKLASLLRPRLRNRSVRSGAKKPVSVLVPAYAQSQLQKIQKWKLARQDTETESSVERAANRANGAELRPGEVYLADYARRRKINRGTLLYAASAGRFRGCAVGARFAGDRWILVEEEWERARKAKRPPSHEFGDDAPVAVAAKRLRVSEDRIRWLIATGKIAAETSETPEGRRGPKEIQFVNVPAVKAILFPDPDGTVSATATENANLRPSAVQGVDRGADHRNGETPAAEPEFVSANEDRDRWIYEQRLNLVSWKAILCELNRLAPDRGWEPFERDSSCRTAVARFLERHPELPPPPRGKSGRPPSGK